MAYKVLGIGISILFLTGCETFFGAQQTVQDPPETLQCPVVEPVVCPELPPVPEVKPEPPKPEVKAPEQPVDCAKPASYNSKYHRLGQVEYVDIMPMGFRQKARIDTGAETTSIDAVDIVEFERDGRAWVQFAVKDRNTDESVMIKAPIKRTVLIKQHGNGDIRRQVVLLTLAIGELKEEVEVTLADRENFEYPILVGRNFLQGRALVDVSRKFLSLE